MLFYLLLTEFFKYDRIIVYKKFRRKKKCVFADIAEQS